jgi:hypothetical protein
MGITKILFELVLIIYHLLLFAYHLRSDPESLGQIIIVLLYFHPQIISFKIEGCFDCLLRDEIELFHVEDDLI